MAERKLRSSTLDAQPGKYAPDPPSDGLLSDQATSSPAHTGDNATYVDVDTTTPVKNYDPKKRASLNENRKARVVKRSRYGKRCGFCKESFKGNRDHEFFHAMEKCTPLEFVHHVEPQWGRAHGTLNIFESRWNIGVATASLHKAFDSSAFMLLPEKSVLERVRDYTESPMERRKPFDEVWYFSFQSNVPSTDVLASKVFKLLLGQYWVYTFFPLTWNKKRSIFIKNLNETGDPANSEEEEPEKPDDEDKFPNAPGYTEFRPWNKDDNGRHVPLEVEFHIHPFYMIYNAGQKLAVLPLNKYLEISARDERIHLISTIWEAWIMNYDGPPLVPSQPSDEGDRNLIPTIQTAEQQGLDDTTSQAQDKEQQPLRIPIVAADEDNYQDSEDEADEADPEISHQGASRITGDEHSTAIPPPSTVVGPSSAVDGNNETHGHRKPGGAKSTVSAPIRDRMDRVLGLSSDGRRRVAMTDLGYGLPGSSPTPQNRWSPFPLPNLPAKRKYEDGVAASEPRQGSMSMSLQPPPVPPKPPRARTVTDGGLGQNSNQDQQDTQSSATFNMPAQAVRRSSRHQMGSAAGRSTGSGGTTNSSIRIGAGPGPRARSAASAGSSRALRAPVQDTSDESGDGSGEYLPNNSKRRKQQ
ncbi:hypothetical protein VNI00_011264 [Paramarasmius palmivorus]|uniref:Uncharacterized protein n=1 Tax=Paramarasmius palmivorus TaxID=297713 RepID=A0AAW0CD06_9AGAR